jgi:murein DD-endopeptidase MepM/ murein hydrolase activator NlpD
MAPIEKKPAKGPKAFVANAPVGEGSVHLVRTVGVDFGDQSIWARSLVNARRRKGLNSPSAIDFENAITGIQITDTIDGSSTIVVKFQDPDWHLIRSGFFDCNDDGQLDALDVNYPAGSELWWRSSQVTVDANRSSASIELTLIERAVAMLQHKKGPLKTGRNKSTRAEFIANLVSRVKAVPLDFQCQQLHEKQQIEKDNRSQPSAGTYVALSDANKPVTVTPDHPKAKKKGIHAKANVTVKGKKVDQEQIDAIDICMKVADRLNAPPRAVLVMCTAAIGESEFRPSAGEQVYGTHKGVFQSNQIPQFDTKQQCTYFLKGGRSFLAGGAIGIVKAHPEYSPGTCAAKVEISDGSAGYYDGFVGEAKAIIEAYGGGGLGSTAGGSTEYRKQYNFEVGGPDNPDESFWDAMKRLRDDVKWALFVDGNSVYYDAETTLIRAKPATYVDRLDESVVSFSSTWDTRNIATEATLVMICDPFEFRAGDVLVLRGFGPASSGSAVDPPLPGRWLISEIDRDRFDFVSTFRLKQPEAPGKEPAADIGTRKGKDAAGGTSGGSGATGGAWPGQFPVTGAYGTQRPGHIHAGLDVGVPHGTDCTAPFDGTITYVASSGFGVAGGMVHLRADSNTAGLVRGDKVGWGHCVSPKVKVGDKVKAGKVVAKSNGSPAHVHFVLIRKNDGGNGIDGNADPSEFLKGINSIPGGTRQASHINTDQYYVMPGGKVIRK